MSKGYLWWPEHPAKQRYIASKHMSSRRSAKLTDMKCSDCCQCPACVSPKHCITPPYMTLQPDVHTRYREVSLTKDIWENLLRKVCFHHCLTYLTIPPSWRGGPQVLSMIQILSISLLALKALLEKSSELPQEPGVPPHPSCLLLPAPPSWLHWYISFQYYKPLVQKR